MQLTKLQQFLYEDLKIQGPKERRHLLIEEMSSLTEKEIHCFHCTGTCCTMSANSMQITPLEALEIILSLNVSVETLPELKLKLQKNIQDYRLDHEIFLGKKNLSHLRKTYTCPFFSPGPKGCTIKKELKPYGCLGFNPRFENDNGSQCHSDFNLLERREKEQLRDEDLACDYLKKELGLQWNKLEIPKAVLALLDKLELS
ncbi:MAG: hypothetical protein ACXVLQ_09355 [Bacteriovorax sp.]